MVRSLIRRLLGREEVHKAPLFHPPEGPLAVSDRIDEIDLALERDRQRVAPRVVLACISLGSLASGGGLPGAADPIARVSMWSEHDRYER
jgi:hypothetical protein